MKRIAVLHTIKDVIVPFTERLKAAADEEIVVYNTLDEALTADVNRDGFTERNLTRLMLILKSMELQEPELIICTCTTMSAGIEELRGLISVPILAIDDALCGKAVETGSGVAILASVSGLLAPTKAKLKKAADAAGKTADAVVYLCEAAMTALRAGNREEHDRLVLSTVKEIKNADVVILPQASMSHLKEQIESITGLPVLLCTDLCVESFADRVNRDR